MTTTTKNPDITVRGGLINVPNSSQATQPPRHQPNTPPNKKHAPPRSDYQPAPKTTEPAVTETIEKPKGETDHVPTETSQSD